MNEEINLEYYFDEQSKFCDIYSETPFEDLLRAFLLDINSKIRFKVIYKLIKRGKGSYPTGEFLDFIVNGKTITIQDDFGLDLGIEEIHIKSHVLLPYLKSWEKFLKKYNKLRSN